MTRVLHRSRVILRRAVYRFGALHSMRLAALKVQRRWSRGRTLPWRFAAFGQGSVIARPFVVSAPDRVAIGDAVIIGRHARLSVNASPSNREGEPMLCIGSRSNFGDGLMVSCSGSIVIGRDVLAAPNVFIADTYHDYRDPDRPILGQGMTEPRPVQIDDGAFLGVNAVVLPGTHIGKRAYIGAGAVVTSDIPPLSIAVGNPARVVRYWDAGAERWRDASDAPDAGGTGAAERDESHET